MRTPNACSYSFLILFFSLIKQRHVLFLCLMTAFGSYELRHQCLPEFAECLQQELHWHAASKGTWLFFHSCVTRWLNTARLSFTLSLSCMKTKRLRARLNSVSSAHRHRPRWALRNLLHANLKGHMKEVISLSLVPHVKQSWIRRGYSLFEVIAMLQVRAIDCIHERRGKHFMSGRQIRTWF